MKDRDKCAYPRAPDATKWAQNLVMQSDCSDLAEKKRKGTHQPLKFLLVHGATEELIMLIN